MKLYAFLGTSKYEPCKYRSEAAAPPFTSPSVCFVQTAVALKMGSDFEGATIFATKDAREKNATLLRKEFQQNHLAEPTVVSVPAGHTQEEIYEIFDALKDHIDEQSPVVFDITHGYRSQPILGVMILNYLQSLSSGFELVDLLYGAFDPLHYREQGTENTEYPIVSLMPLWELNEWSAAFQNFDKTGNAGLLSKYAERTQRQYMSALGGPPPERPGLINFAKALQEWQQAIELCAVPQLYARNRYFDLLQHQLDAPWNDFTQELGRFVKPLRERLQQIVEPMYTERWDSIDGLRAQLEIMRWMNKYGRHQPFLTMAREWLKTFTALAISIPVEELHELYFGAAVQLSLCGKLEPDVIEDLDSVCGAGSYQTLLHLGEVFGSQFYVLAKDITEARNGVNHCWIGRSPEETNAIKIATGTAQKVLDEFPVLLDKLRVELGEIAVIEEA